MVLYTESVADKTDHFAEAFVSKSVVYCYDVVTRLWYSKFTADAILLREIQCKKRDI